MTNTNVPQRPGATAQELTKIISTSSVRILCVGDIHLSDRPPASCYDTYTDDILDILSFIAKLEHALDAQATTWAGDIFHHKQPSRTSHQTLVKLAKVAQQYKNPPLVVTGNHDITSDRLDSLDKQPLGVLYETGVLQKLEGWHETLPICGVPWQQRWLSPSAIEEAFAEWRGGFPHGYHWGNDKSLAVTHAPIYPPSVADNVMFELLPLSEVSDAMRNAGYLYYGHIHEPHYKFEVDGVTYCNMGAISRGSLHEYNLTRKIQVALWTPEHGFTPIDVPHKPASEVFKLVEAQEKKEVKMDLDSFLDEVGSATLDISSTGSIIDHVRRMDVEEEVKSTSIELLEEVS
jgi:DNA repair exonuclease SbcCD nuclease subunit